MAGRDMRSDEYRFDRVQPNVPPIDPWILLAWLGAVATAVACTAGVVWIIGWAIRFAWHSLT